MLGFPGFKLILSFAKTDRCQRSGFSLGFAGSPVFPISRSGPLWGFIARRSSETPGITGVNRVLILSFFATCRQRATHVIENPTRIVVVQEVEIARFFQAFPDDRALKKGGSRAKAQAEAIPDQGLPTQRTRAEATSDSTVG